MEKTINKCYAPYIRNYRSYRATPTDTGIDTYCSWFGEACEMKLQSYMVFATCEDASEFAINLLNEDFDSFNSDWGVQENTYEWYQELFKTSTPNLQVVDKNLNPLDIKVVPSSVIG